MPDFSLQEIIEGAISGALDQVFVARPGKITAYDPITHTVVVQPLVKHARYVRSTGEARYVEMPEIPFVPVLSPRAGGMVLRLPIQPGDTVLLVFSDVELGTWRTSGDLAEPVDARRHSLGWPVAIPGLFADVAPMSPLDAPMVGAGTAIFGEDGGKQLRIGPLGIEFAPAGTMAVMPIALAPPLAAAATAGAAAATASATSGGSLANALSLIKLALFAITSIPANSAAAAASANAGVGIDTAITSQGAADTAQGAAATAMTAAAAQAASTLVRSF